MKLCIAGGRNLHPKLDQVTAAVEASGAEVVQVEYVISGGAPGADKAGELWALANNISIVTYAANWRLHGNAANPIRNRKMAEACDLAIVFWDGESLGTKGMIRCMRDLGKRAHIVWLRPPCTEFQPIPNLPR